MIPREHSVEVTLHTDLATAQKELVASVGVLEWQGDGVLLRGQADDLEWVARELARLPFDFSVRTPAALRGALGRAARRLARLASVD
jgi:predicted DNA-binding transcriptional regulator YafY